MFYVLVTPVQHYRPSKGKSYKNNIRNIRFGVLSNNGMVSTQQNGSIIFEKQLDGTIVVLIFESHNFKAVE